MLPQKYHSLVIKRKINCYSCTNGGNLKSYISKTSIVCPKKKKYTKIDWSFKEQQIMYLVTQLCRFSAGVVEVNSINLLANCFV